MPQNLLEQLRKYTVVVADTGDMEAMEKFHPQDATTNPSLITAAAQMPQYQPIVDGVLTDARKELGEGASDKAVANLAFKRLAVAFGKKILAIIPGRVSTEVDARLSYDTEKTIGRRATSLSSTTQAGIGREPRTHQDRLDLGGHSRRRGSGKGRHPLQSDAAFRPAPGHRRRRRGRHADLALRGPHPRLVQEGHGQGLSRRRRSRRAVGDAHLQLLQEIRLQNRGDGRQLPQHRRDRRAGRLRSAHHFAAISGRARIHPGRAAAQALAGSRQDACRSKRSPWTKPPSTACTPPTAWPATN